MTFHFPNINEEKCCALTSIRMKLLIKYIDIYYLNMFDTDKHEILLSNFQIESVCIVYHKAPEILYIRRNVYK